MLDEAILKHVEFARRLLAYEIALDKSAEQKNSGAFRVCEKLREPLAKLMGFGGVRSLLSRALALAGVEVSDLRTLRIGEEGSLEGLGELEARIEPRALAECEAVLVSKLLGLLLIFIGLDLTLRLLQGVWPKADDADF
jgi:hypothetical protein